MVIDICAALYPPTMAVQDGHVPMGEPQNGHLQMNGSSVTEPTVPLPHPGRVFTSTQYLTEEYITRQLLIGFPDSGKEIHDRFEGVDLIDSLVEVLGL